MEVAFFMVSQIITKIDNEAVNSTDQHDVSGLQPRSVRVGLHRELVAERRVG